MTTRPASADESTERMVRKWSAHLGSSCAIFRGMAQIVGLKHALQTEELVRVRQACTRLVSCGIVNGFVK